MILDSKAEFEISEVGAKIFLQYQSSYALTHSLRYRRFDSGLSGVRAHVRERDIWNQREEIETQRKQLLPMFPRTPWLCRLVPCVVHKDRLTNKWMAIGTE